MAIVPPWFVGTTAQFPDLSLLPATGVVAATWSNPLMGRLTSAFGMRAHPILNIFLPHSGTDIAAACGTPVYAAADGVVVFVGTNFQWRTGNQVVIAHGDGVITRYGHLLSGTIDVRLGDRVKVGQQIAAVGGDRRLDPVGAGQSTGCHLHFEVNFDDGVTPVNAQGFLQQLGIRLGLDAPVVMVEEAPLDEAAAEELVLAIMTDYVDVIPGVVPEFRLRPREHT
ncbi:MAG TPA: M23 family metallopeptidase [Actinomycetales bacterium]|nr:M23 family metallopeptidase [Actinomycetales bacterium]